MSEHEPPDLETCSKCKAIYRGTIGHICKKRKQSETCYEKWLRLKGSICKTGIPRRPKIAIAKVLPIPTLDEIPIIGTRYKLGKEIRTMKQFRKTYNRIGFTVNGSDNVQYTNWEFWVLWIKQGAKKLR